MLDSLPIILMLLAIAALSLPERISTPVCIPIEPIDIVKGEHHA